jgi:metallo-beta-lactamase class B
MRWTIILIVLAALSLPQLHATVVEEIKVDNDIQLIHLGDSVFIHVTWDEVEGYGRFSSNGMLVIRKGKVLMIDTPMDNEKTKRLTDYLSNNFKAKVTKLVIGHFHNDCLGGLAYLKSIGVESVANILTITKCNELGLPVPKTSFFETLIFDFQGETVRCQFFGGGHTFDNITVWLSGKKILFGGCLVKSVDSKTLGNLSDAVIEDWDITIAKVIQTYPDAQVVVPGHGQYGGTELLEQTIKLVQEFREKQKGNL